MRLPGMDYTFPGPFFITICTEKREPLFGTIRDDKMHPNELGEVVIREWNALPQLSPWVSLRIFTLMPNHIHGIFALGWDAYTHPLPDAPLPRFDRIMGAFKSRTTIAVNRIRGTPGAKVWQRGYYERVISNERSYEAIWHYIVANPANWRKDREYVEVPDRPQGGGGSS